MLLSIPAAVAWAQSPSSFEPRVPHNYENVMRSGPQAAAPAPATPTVRTAQAAPARDMAREPKSAEPMRSGPLPRWYAGASIGRAGYDASLDTARRSIDSTGATTYFVTPHAYDGVWKAFAGYRLSPSWSVEATYWNLGGPRYRAEVTAPAATTFDRSFSAHAVGVHAAYWLPITAPLSAFAKLGGVYARVRAGEATPGAGLATLQAETAKTWNALWGVGLDYRFASQVSARVEYDQIRKVGNSASFGSADVHLWTVGLSFSF